MLMIMLLLLMNSDSFMLLTKTIKNLSQDLESKIMQRMTTILSLGKLMNWQMAELTALLEILRISKSFTQRKSVSTAISLETLKVNLFKSSALTSFNI
jgi:hypothetical protein